MRENQRKTITITGILIAIILCTQTAGLLSGCDAAGMPGNGLFGTGTTVSDPGTGGEAPQNGSGPQGVPVAGDRITPGDYSKKDNWLLLPKNCDKPVDVFYLYPTSWSIKKATDYPICSLDMKKMRSTAKSNAKKQATAFEQVGNLFAPYYRQVAVAFVLDQPPETRGGYFGGVPAADAEAAFRYYIEHYNEGRPFILVGHSQGAAVVKELLFGYMKENPEIYSRMVAAYVIGYSVTEQDLAQHPWLRFAEGAEDTGVIISYNTEAPEIDGTNNTVLPGSIAINPLSWTRGEAPSPADRNPGSYIKVDGKMKMVSGLADAAVNTARGTVICTSVDRDEFKGKNPLYFPTGVYHSYDIAFYYTSLGQNAQLRTDAWLAAQGQQPGSVK